MRQLSYKGLAPAWSTAMLVAHAYTARTGRRHAVRHLRHVNPRHLPHCGGAVWAILEAGPCS